MLLFTFAENFSLTLKLTSIYLFPHLISGVSQRVLTVVTRDTLNKMFGYSKLSQYHRSKQDIKKDRIVFALLSEANVLEFEKEQKTLRWKKIPQR